MPDPPAKPTPASLRSMLPPVTEPVLLAWPLDHFYSPVPDSRLLFHEPASSRVWPSEPRPTPGIDWREQEQAELLTDHLTTQSPIDLPNGPTGDPRDYHAENPMFSRLDAWMLQAMLRHLRPRRMIEVGSGFSSLLAARINREFLGGALHLSCIDPYPPQVLRDGVEGVSELIDSPVEVLGADRFLGLGTGDVLFIDSSHTIKTGGDVQFLFDQVIPRLAAGVVVHVHDIFLPWDYPPDWVFAGRAWNEQYLVRAFLTFNSAFRILLGVKWLEHYRSDLLAASVPAYPSRYEHSGGSLWIQRVTDANGGQAPPPVRRPAPAATFARRMDIGDLASNLHIHRERLDQARADLGDQIRWYPYDIIGNLIHIDRLLHGENRDLSRLAGGKPVADIGGADGDLAFALEKSGGWQVDLIDTRATNMNGLQAARTLKEHFGSSVQICDIDLDAQFHLPRERYGLVLLLGILYHLQNPFYVLRQLSQRADYCILSTRVARYAGAERTRVAELPMAYLVGPQETNNDATNYWMFTPAGLDRVVARAGWSVLESVSFGDTENSDPSTAEHDERAFMLLRTTSPG